MKKFTLTHAAFALLACGFSAGVLAQTPAPNPAPAPAMMRPASATPGMMRPAPAAMMPASAAHPMMHPASGAMRHHGHADQNGDRMITREEAKGHPRLEKNFVAIDTNKDGKLSPDEIKAFRAQHHKGHPNGHHMKNLDANGDGMISRSEAKGHPFLEKNFDSIDTNKDGQLSKAERQAAHPHHRHARAAAPAASAAK